MDEHLHRIDDLFKKALEEHSETPSRKVWENLDKNLEKKKVVSITKKYKKWKWVAAALFIFSFSMAMYTWNLKLRYKEVASKNKSKTANTINRNEIRSYDTGSKAGSNSPKELAAGKSNTRSSVAGDSSTVNKPKAISKTSDTKNNTASASDAIIKTGEVRNNRITRPSDLAKSNKTDQFEKSLSSSNLNRKDKSTKDITVKTNVSNSTVESYKKADDRLNTLSIKDKYDVGKSVAISPKNLSQFNTPAIAINDKTGTSAPLNNPSLNYKNRSRQLAKKRFYTATFFISGQSVSTRLSNDRPRFREDDRREIKQKENLKFSRSIGVLIGCEIGKGLSVQTGVSVVTRVTDIESKTLFARPDNMGHVNFRISCSSGYAYVATKSGSAPISGDSIPSLSSATTLKYVSVPLGLQYSIRNGNFSFNPAVAVAANFKTHGKIETVLSTQSGKENTATDIEGLKASYFDGSVRMDIAYDITKTIGVSVMPAARFGLSSITKNSPVKTYVNSLGLGVGLNVHF